MSYDPTTDPNVIQWQSDVNATQQLATTTIEEQEQKIALAAAMMGSLPTMTAYHMIPLLMGMLAQEQGIQQVGVPSDSLNSQNDALNLITETQQQFNDLIAGSQQYATDFANGVNDSFDANYEQEFTDFNNNLTALDYMFSQPGWCSDSVEQSMTTSIGNIQTSMNNLSTWDSTEPAAWNFANACVDYNQNPSASQFAPDFNVINESLNSMTSTMNYVTSTTTGQMKAGTSEIQQFYGAVEGSGKSLQQQGQYWVNNQLSQ